MVLIAPPSSVENVLSQSDGYVIGQMQKGIKGVQFTN